jgi:hypothetical protein
MNKTEERKVDITVVGQNCAPGTEVGSKYGKNSGGTARRHEQYARAKLRASTKRRRHG